MPQRPNNLPLIIVVVVALAGIVGLNVMQQNSDPAIREKIDKEREREAAKKQAEVAKTAPDPVIPGANQVVAWPAEQNVGKPNATPKITIAWEWTPALQGNPSSVYNTVETVKRVTPSATINVINLDSMPGVAKPGISVDGTLRVPTAPDGTFPQEAQLIGPLMSAAHSK